MAEEKEITEKDEQALGHTLVRFFPKIAKWMFPLAIGFGGISLGGGASTWIHSQSRDNRIDTGIVVLRQVDSTTKRNSIDIRDLNNRVAKLIAVIDSTPTGKKMEKEYHNIHHGSPFAIEFDACICPPNNPRHN